jgi:hypothetical protein
LFIRGFFTRGIASIQNLANLASQGLLSERLVKQVRTLLEYAMTCYEAIGVAGHIEHFHFWLARSEAFAKDATIHAGHDHIGKQKVDGAGMLPGGLQSLLAIGGTENVVAALFQEHLSQFAQGVGIFHKQEAVSMGRRNTRPKSTCRGLNS